MGLAALSTEQPTSWEHLAPPSFMMPYAKSRSSRPRLFTFSFMTMLTFIARCWWYLGSTCVRVLLNHYFTPSQASLYLHPTCIIISGTYLWNFFWLVTFTHLSLALKKGMILWTNIYSHFLLPLKNYFYNDFFNFNRCYCIKCLEYTM